MGTERCLIHKSRWMPTVSNASVSTEGGKFKSCEKSCHCEISLYWISDSPKKQLRELGKEKRSFLVFLCPMTGRFAYWRHAVTMRSWYDSHAVPVCGIFPCVHFGRPITPQPSGLENCLYGTIVGLYKHYHSAIVGHYWIPTLDCYSRGTIKIIAKLAILAYIVLYVQLQG